ncbi:hypothetical protein V1264_015570 [Littorina saxatilis]|uniref:Uncharacterized protein n=1 Tax=Littorina saxatilis TaxID=31220 RepID=A0AAN9GI55_9CAEN
MTETEQLITLLREQMEQQQRQHKEDMEQQMHQMEMMMKAFSGAAAPAREESYDDPSASNLRFPITTQAAAIPSFVAFDATSELWPDYWSRFCTFVVANSEPEQRKAQVFWTNQTATVYKQLANLATQQNPPKDINCLTMDEIVKFMKEQFDPKLFLVRERFKFWSDMKRKPGEALQELAARIRQDAATCDFPSIKNPQDEALRQMRLS